MGGSLWDSDEIRRALLEQVGDYFLLLEPKGGDRLPTIVETNEAALRAHGYSRDEVIGQPITLFDTSTSEEALLHAMRSLEAGEPFAFDAQHKRKDGTFFYVAIRSVMLNVDGRKLVISIERDITERKRAEAQLAHSQRLMSYIISHARSCIAVHDRDLRYIYVSERYLKEYHVAERDVIGKHHYEVFPDLPQKWREAHQRALTGEVSSSEEDQYRRADGSLEWTRWECRPWYEMDGTIGGIIVYTEVITQRKKEEEERRALQNQLQQAMKMEAVGRLAGGVAHDFNNLLTVITANVGLSLMDIPAGTAAAERLREIGDAADRAAALTRQLLTFSRRQLIEPKLLDLNDVVGNMRGLLVRLLGEDVTLRFALAPGLPAVRIDPGQFEQVLVNLAVNARDAMPNGGEIVIQTSCIEFDDIACATHSEARPGEFVQLTVSDNGNGMTDEVKQHLFEPFFTTKAKGCGTGLGLSTTFGIVKQASGFIDVYSEHGHGTTFKIYLPTTPGQATHAVRTTSALPGGSETILLVEDELRVREAARRCLVRLGYTVLDADSGAEALAKLARHNGKIDLLVTDVIMPRMNGRELAELTARMLPEIKVLFVSGYPENVVAKHGILEPGLHFISKPYTPKRLADKVREVLSA